MSTIIVCNEQNCSYYDEYDFCTKRIIEVKDGICQIAWEHLLMEMREADEQTREKKVNEE